MNGLFGDEEKKKNERWSDRDIERIYDAYPRKVAKAAAMKAIRKALFCIVRKIDTEADPLAWLLARVQKFAASHAGQRGEFTPHPATWFNQGRYDDDDAQWGVGSQPAPRRGSGPDYRMPETIKPRVVHGG